MENNYMCVNLQSSPVRSSPVRSSLERTGEAIVDSVLARWDIIYADSHEREDVIALANIVAGVMVLQPNATIKVDGNAVPAGWAAHILGMSTGMHVRYVLENYNRLTYKVNKAEPYLRSMLYHSVTEIGLATDNEVAADFGGGAP